jgi:hypothetical protein
MVSTNADLAAEERLQSAGKPAIGALAVGHTPYNYRCRSRVEVD